MDKKLIQLGQVVKDRITNFKGTVTARAIYITGPDRLLVEGFADGSNKPAETAWFDEGRLEISE